MGFPPNMTSFFFTILTCSVFWEYRCETTLVTVTKTHPDNYGGLASLNNWSKSNEAIFQIVLEPNTVNLSSINTVYMGKSHGKAAIQDSGVSSYWTLRTFPPGCTVLQKVQPRNQEQALAERKNIQF